MESAGETDTLWPFNSQNLWTGQDHTHAAAQKHTHTHTRPSGPKLPLTQSPPNLTILGHSISILIVSIWFWLFIITSTFESTPSLQLCAGGSGFLLGSGMADVTTRTEQV